MSDNIDRTLMQRQTVRQVEKMLEDISAVATQNGFSDPIVKDNNITYSYEQMMDPAEKRREFNMLFNAMMDVLFVSPTRPKPSLAFSNDAPDASNKPKATLFLISKIEIDQNHINFDF